MISARENLKRTIAFQSPERVAFYLDPAHGSDIVFTTMSPYVDARPFGKFESSTDEWGSVWRNIGVCNFGEVVTPALADWEDFGKLRIPDVEDHGRWQNYQAELDAVGQDKYILGYGISIYERIHFLRGLENTWTDIYCEEENLRALIDLLVEMNLKAIDRYRSFNRVDGFIFNDDWGLQDRLMISPEKWREIWAPAYRRIYSAAHEAGMATFLHSCGHITDILGDLIDCGLDVIQMDQQLNMSLEALSRFRGRITFWCPVDIQAVMPRNDIPEIRDYCHRLFRALAAPDGGFIAKYYEDSDGAGHSPEAVKAMAEEFLSLSYSEVPPLKKD